MSNLIRLEDVENLPIDKIHNLYRGYVNNTRVDLLSVFGFGNDTVSHAEGIFIYLNNGRKVYDFTGGIGVLNHGHNHPRILNARRNFLNAKKMEVHKNYFSPYIAALSYNISSLLPGDLKYSFFPNSGAEALDAAMRASYKYHELKRPYILYSDIAFHGKLLGPSSITSSPENDYAYPQIPGTLKYSFGNIESITELISKYRDSKGVSQIAAIVCEPFSVSNMRHSSEKYLRQLQEITNQEKILLIFDEVYTGWCKTGTLFYFMRYKNLVPDILCMAKSFGGGKASIAGVVFNERVYKKTFDDPSSANLLMSTFYGFGEETATAIEAVNIMIDDDYEGKAKNIESILAPKLEMLKLKYPNQIEGWGGVGALFGVFLNCGPEIFGKIVNLIPGKIFKDKLFVKKLITASVVSELYDSHGILTFTSFANNTHLIISPPIIASKEDLDYLVQSLDDVFKKGLLNLVANFAKKKFLKR
jgi:putrescine aminotransferase